jgi:hypothetical protein
MVHCWRSTDKLDLALPSAFLICSHMGMRRLNRSDLQERLYRGLIGMGPGMRFRYGAGRATEPFLAARKMARILCEQFVDLDVLERGEAHPTSEP